MWCRAGCAVELLRAGCDGDRAGYDGELLRDRCAGELLRAEGNGELGMMVSY